MKKALFALAFAMGAHTAAFCGVDEGFLKGPNAASSCGVDEGVAAKQADDYSQAFQQCKALADQGRAKAQNKLGLMYREGLGVVQNYQHATNWFRKSATQGDAEGQYHLGESYNYGQGVTQDLVLAYMLYNLAAATGFEPAVEKRHEILQDMSVQQIEEAQALSMAWKTGYVLPTQSDTGSKNVAGRHITR